MQTITFYSYKGGVGRTLFVANVAKYLARLGQDVFLIDFDLEAPGLHYKFSLDKESSDNHVTRGVVDYIHSFVTENRIPDRIEDYVKEVAHAEDDGGVIQLFPAGNAPSTEYWQKLSQIEWHALFYTEGAKGIPFFLELKERIRRDFDPDFLLIDSRTGITEIGGVATTVLPDKLVCLLLNNRENLEGAREVLRSIKRTPRLQGQRDIEILPVVTRIPKMEHLDVEEQIISDIREYLNEEASDLRDTLSFSEVFILHSEPDLQISESLSIGGKKTLAESPLLQDYLRLFSHLIPKEVIEPRIGPLITEAVGKLMDDPEGTRRDLEALIVYCPHSNTYQALLKYYRLRNEDPRKMLNVAKEYWQVTGISDDPLLWQIVKEKLDLQSVATTTSLLDFGEAVWRSAGENDIRVGLLLFQGNIFARRIAPYWILKSLSEAHGPIEDVVVRHIAQLKEDREFDAALSLITKYKSSLVNSSKFQTAWAQLIVALADQVEAENLLSLDLFSFEAVRSESPATAAYLAQLAGDAHRSQDVMDKLADKAIATQEMEELMDTSDLFRRFNRLPDFLEKVRQTMGPQMVDEIERRVLLRRRASRNPARLRF